MPSSCGVAHVQRLKEGPHLGRPALQSARVGRQLRLYRGFVRRGGAARRRLLDVVVHIFVWIMLGRVDLGGIPASHAAPLRLLPKLLEPYLPNTMTSRSHCSCSRGQAGEHAMHDLQHRRYQLRCAASSRDVFSAERLVCQGLDQAGTMAGNPQRPGHVHPQPLADEEACLVSDDKHRPGVDRHRAEDERGE